MEFQEIKTQDELDRIVLERLKREKETNSKKYEGWISPEDQAKATEKATASMQKQIDDLTKASADEAKKYAGYDKELADRDAKIKAYETDSVKTRIALKTGLPYEMASRLRGDSEKDIQSDADALKAVMGSSKPIAPLANAGDQGSGNSSNAALTDMLRKMKGE